MRTTIAAVLVDPVALGSWLAGMERRERLGRTWNTEQGDLCGPPARGVTA